MIKTFISVALLVVAAVAPTAAAEPDDAGIDILGGSAGTFAFSGTTLGEPIDGSFDGSGGSALPGHPSAISMGDGGIDILSGSAGTFTFDAVDACESGAGIALVARNLPGTFEITVSQPSTGAARTYSQADGQPGVGFIDPQGFLCPGDAPIDGGGAAPDQIRGTATQRLAAGNRNRCLRTFSFDGVLRGQGDAASATRIFGGGAGRDRLEIVAVDATNDAAVYWTRTPRYSAMWWLQPRGQGLRGHLVEGGRNAFSRADARDLLEAAESPETIETYLRRTTRPAGSCAWRSDFAGRDDAQLGPLWRAALGIAPGTPFVVSQPPAMPDPSQAGDRIVVETSLADGTMSRQTQDPILPDGDGIFWFFDPTDTEALVRTLHGCNRGDRLWVFYGGLSEVGVELKVTDTQSGASQSYSLTPGSASRPYLDTGALADCEAP